MSDSNRKRVFLHDDDLPNDPHPGAPRGDKVREPGGLSRIEQRFCHHYTSTARYDVNRAAMDAGYAPSRAFLMGRKLLEEPRIRQYIAAIESDRLRRMRFDGDEFLAREIVLAQADVTELVETWVPPCRYCWGQNNEYQRTHAEFQEAWDEWMRQPDRKAGQTARVIMLRAGDVVTYDNDGKKLPFDQKGGDGYDPEMPPNPGCPNCHGRGNEDPEQGTIPYMRIKDSRYLSPAGRILYAGLKHGPRGIEVLMQSQDAARTRLMGMIGRFLELRAAGKVQAGNLGLGFGLANGVADLLTDDPRSLSDQQLDRLLLEHGIVIDDDGQAGEGDGSGGDRGEAPPPGRIA